MGNGLARGGQVAALAPARLATGLAATTVPTSAADKTGSSAPVAGRPLTELDHFHHQRPLLTSKSYFELVRSCFKKLLFGFLPKRGLFKRRIK
jgi:hypothetical protein